MNVLLITWNFPPKIGGLESVVYNLYKRLDEFHPVQVIAPYSRSLKGQQEPAGKIYRPPFPSLAFFAAYAFIKGASLIRRGNIDVIFAGSGLISPVAVILGRIFRKKTVTHVFGLDVIYPYFLYQRCISFFLPKNDYVISISSSTKTELIKRKCPSEKIIVIHPGIDIALFSDTLNQAALKKKYGLQAKKVLLSVCRLAKRKGIVEFVDSALPKILQAVPETVYIVAGGNPRESLAHKQDIMEDVRGIIKARSQEEKVKLFGYVAQEALRELYYLCDIFVLPVIPMKGDVEGFGLSFIEANAAGKPVVGTRTGGITEAVLDGESGILVEPNDYESLSETIISLLQNPKRCTALGAKGQKRAHEEFSWDTVIKKYLDVFENIRPGELNSERWERSYVKVRRNLWLRQKRIKMFNLNKCSKILELGCGDGLNLKILQKLGYPEVFGLDNSHALLSRISGARIVAADACEIALADNSFDVVLIDSVLHHIRNLDGCLKEIRRILKPGGVLCFMEPRDSFPRRILDMLTYSWLSHLSAYLTQRKITLQEEQSLYSHWLKNKGELILSLKAHGFETIFWKKNPIGMLVKCSLKKNSDENY